MYSNYKASLTVDLLLTEAEHKNLYSQLVKQINKDFDLTGVSVDFPYTISPLALKTQLQEKIYQLIQYKFSEYLNLLYIIDIAEEQIRQLGGSDLIGLSEQVCFLILKREWQKVWFRNKP